jgi:hypothetical protein
MFKKLLSSFTQSDKKKKKIFEQNKDVGTRISMSRKNFDQIKKKTNKSSLPFFYNNYLNNPNFNNNNDKIKILKIRMIASHCPANVGPT